MKGTIKAFAIVLGFNMVVFVIPMYFLQSILGKYLFVYPSVIAVSLIIYACIYECRMQKKNAWRIKD